eukprot:m.267868 g.267868  ORF g.267868 m.267868 type:complete len:56 (-) comp72231_c0_seq1:103-270(-)
MDGDQLEWSLWVAEMDDLIGCRLAVVRSVGRMSTLIDYMAVECLISDRLWIDIFP